MSESPSEIFDELLTKWIEEFGRAVEMFTGEKPVISFSRPAAELSDAAITERTWWKQVVQQNDRSFAIWSGVTAPIWNAIGEGEQAQASLFEMLSQANQGSAAALSEAFPTPLRCQDGLIEAPIPAVQTELANISVLLRGVEAGVISLLLDKSAFAILRPQRPDKTTAAPDREPVRPTPTNVRLSLLLDLRLPVTVVLGRATITINDALKITPGSIVELDSEVGDDVEIIVHGTVVAKGEIVSVKGNYGVRIKEVISRRDRMALHEAA